MQVAVANGYRDSDGTTKLDIKVTFSPGSSEADADAAIKDFAVNPYPKFSTDFVTEYGLTTTEGVQLMAVPTAPPSVASCSAVRDGLIKRNLRMSFAELNHPTLVADQTKLSQFSSALTRELSIVFWGGQVGCCDAFLCPHIVPIASN